MGHPVFGLAKKERLVIVVGNFMMVTVINCSSGGCQLPEGSSLAFFLRVDEKQRKGGPTFYEVPQTQSIDCSSILLYVVHFCANSIMHPKVIIHSHGSGILRRIFLLKDLNFSK